MPTRKNQSGKTRPWQWVVGQPPGLEWGKLKLSPETPLIIWYAHRLAVNLHEAMTAAGLSARSLAREADMSDATVGAILSGENWPDMWTIARIEIALGKVIWPGADVLQGS